MVGQGILQLMTSSWTSAAEVEHLPRAPRARQAPQAEWCININDQPVPEQPIPEPIECSICFETIQPTNRTILKCKHEFCSECFGTAMRAPNSGNCPVCRDRVLPRQPEPSLDLSSSDSLVSNTLGIIQMMPREILNTKIDNYLLSIGITQEHRNYYEWYQRLRAFAYPIIEWYRQEAEIY